MKATDKHKYKKYPMKKVFLLHSSTTLVDIPKEVYYKGWLYLDSTRICAPIQRCKILSFNKLYFKIHINFKIQIRLL